MRTSVVLLGALVLALAACSARTDASRDAIVDGTPSDAAQDAVVLVYYPDQRYDCTGTLVAPSIVLTARHCVSDMADGDAVQCGSDGEAVSGGDLGDDYPASDIEVYVGRTRSRFFPDPTARGTKIVHDDATNLCGHDLALLEIEPPVTSVAPARLVLDALPSVGEAVTVVGWGASEHQIQNITRTRAERTGVDVLSIGPTVYDGVNVPPNGFLLGESICDGDSGGPAFDASGIILGIASYGSNGTPESESDPLAACVDAGGGVLNTFTSIAPFADTIRQAFTDTGTAPPPTHVTRAAMRWRERSDP
jgi:hypothetical protein